MKLKNKVAIITGSTRGIGLAVADKFINEGAKVAICGSRPESSNKTFNFLKEKYPNAEIMPVHASMSSSEEINSMFNKVVEKWGYVDVLVNNAGISDTKETEKMTDEDFTRVIDTNLVGMFRCTRAAISIMKEKGGSIINTSSLVSRAGAVQQVAYTASKYAVNGLTRSLARELGPYKIRVNAIAPGVVATEMVKEHVSEDLMQRMSGNIALRKMAEPEELAGAYLHLASDDSSYTTGAIINVDGGIVQ